LARFIDDLVVANANLIDAKENKSAATTIRIASKGAESEMPAISSANFTDVIDWLTDGYNINHARS